MGPQPIVRDVPGDVDLAGLEADLAGDGVAILNPKFADTQPAVAQAVQEARAKGIDNFQVIVLARDYRPDTSLRDLATQVAKDAGEPTSILVMSPSQAAGYSTGQLTRYQIEKAQDGHRPLGLQLGNPPAATRDFASIAQNATFPWTGFTVLLVLAVAAAAGIARIRTRAASRRIDAARRAGVPAKAEPTVPPAETPTIR